MVSGTGMLVGESDMEICEGPARAAVSASCQGPGQLEEVVGGADQGPFVL